MYGKLLGIAVLVASATLLLSVSSCGHGQQLVSIGIQPAIETFGAANIPVIDNAGAAVQLRALGTYIHPPVTKDITNQVTWASNDTQMFTVSSTGLYTAPAQLPNPATATNATAKSMNTLGGGILSDIAMLTPPC